MKTKKHKGRPDLIGEHKVGDTGQAIFAVLFAVVYIADSFIFNFSTWLNDIVPNIIRVPAGTAVLIVSGLFSFKGMRIVFNEVREKPELLRKGVFSLVRHPVYLGEILLYLGMLFFSLSVASMVVWLLAVIFLHLISRYEEKILIEHFGEEYRIYMKEVPMWLPKISGLFKKRQLLI
ncbi:MAG: isoprenylcysteine carboxylmethyltransferase family protein [Bacteroidales bacterium]|nr:isoprenylcysteine carboxylmethyltransferase family protein [Bacteroidales bacterium]MBN2634071.1 isoprenylcysteine carboxylmethyltransferase family protein [Bacteroidales bacterium]